MDDVATQRAIDALTAFGFTALESEVYAFLLQEHPATGYRVAQGIAKPAANVYKALESLERKAAIVLDSASTKEYRPVAPERLLGRLEKEFEKNKVGALKSLASLGKPESGGKLFPVNTLAQAAAQANTIIATGKESVVVIACAQSLSLLNVALSKAWVMSSKPAGAKHIAVPEEMFEVPTLQVVVDRKSAVYAVGEEGQAQGFWVEDHPLAAALHQAIVCQIGLFQVDQALEADLGRKQISKVIEALP
jgi:sugar-specific transcriptional regulator TrmB